MIQVPYNPNTFRPLWHPLSCQGNSSKFNYTIILRRINADHAWIYRESQSWGFEGHLEFFGVPSITRHCTTTRNATFYIPRVRSIIWYAQLSTLSFHLLISLLRRRRGTWIFKTSHRKDWERATCCTVEFCPQQVISPRATVPWNMQEQERIEQRVWTVIL